MKRHPRSVRAAAACTLLLLGACGTAPRQTETVPLRAGAPGEQARTATAAEIGTRPGHVQADVQFMQHMIAHHRQALEMTALVPGRSGRDDVRALARRIELSQDDEIRLMERWLQRRGEPLPDPHAHHHHGHGTHGQEAEAPPMPGMLTAEQLTRLAAAGGAEFDRLFLEYMIFHHEGALVMVAELLAAEGAAQEAEIHQFASHVESDQRIEIERMRRMLNAIERGTT